MWNRRQPERDTAVAAVLHGVDGVTSITLLSANDGVRFAVGRPPINKNAVSITFSAAEVVRRGLAEIERSIAAVVGVLPDLTIAIATAAHQTGFPVLFDDLPSPPPFLQTAWLHVVPSSCASTRAGAASRNAGSAVRAGTT